MEQRTVNQPTTRPPGGRRTRKSSWVQWKPDAEMAGFRRKKDPTANRQRRRLIEALRGQQDHGWSGRKPAQSHRIAKDHPLAAWRHEGRQRLVREALALGVLRRDAQPHPVGPPETGQFLTWQALSAEMQRVRRYGSREVAA